MKTQIKERPAYLTKDGSEIRELLHPDHHSVVNQSLAEARVPAGVTTLLHRHHRSEEIYTSLQERGRCSWEINGFRWHRGRVY